MLREHIWSQFYKLQRYLNIRSLYRMLHFRELRREFYLDLWRISAARVGAEFEEWDFGFSRISRGGMTTLVKGSFVMLDDHLTHTLMGNKALTYSLMREKGYTVPEYCVYTMQDLANAFAFMERFGGPLVVKPASGTGGGAGVTTGIDSPAGLKAASRLASRFGRDLLIERQIEGDSYRLLYIGGEYVDAVRRDRPALTGDGRHSIRGLVGLENRRRLNDRPAVALTPLRIDRDSVNLLRSQGLTPGSRLEAGRRIELKRAVNENAAPQNHGVKNSVHPDTIAMGARLVQDLGVQFAGIDIICKDISARLSPDNGCISEINTTPGLHYHYQVSNPITAVPVAELVLEYMFASRRGVMFLGPPSPEQYALSA